MGNGPGMGQRITTGYGPGITNTRPKTGPLSFLIDLVNTEYTLFRHNLSSTWYFDPIPVATDFK
ncbi:hypothetical protein HanPI659440_Chr04g0147021 [Helianthus annuus]|nr:hypothetical protein HanPI659440_Chr04g0147021 [Helianthus annuus]